MIKEIFVKCHASDGVIDISDTVNETYRRLIDTKEKLVKEQLIKLGWTPPAKGSMSQLEYKNIELKEAIGKIIKKLQRDKFLSPDQLDEIYDIAFQAFKER